MSQFFNNFLATIAGILWHPAVLYILLGVGILFTVWSGFAQFRSLTHGTALILGRHDSSSETGAISHFQALSAALSATVGVGNIGGVALAIALGGPGAVFWMWVVGFLGMAIKTTEVTLSMIYRNTDDPRNPHGGPMWVAGQGLRQLSPKLAGAGKMLGGLFCVTLLISTLTGGLFFQAWNAAVVTEQSFGMPQLVTGFMLSILVGLVILGGIARVGAVAGRIVPLMCGLYLLAAIYVIIINAGMIPEIFGLIFQGAFSGLEAQGAFIGGTAGWAFSAGLQRAFFSNEAGQGSSAIAHSAARTDEPVREGLVAGLEPFIDTLVVCTLTAMVILISGSWNRKADFQLPHETSFSQAGEGFWQLESTFLPQGSSLNLAENAGVTMIAQAHPNAQTGNQKHRLNGQVTTREGERYIEWQPLAATSQPTLASQDAWHTYNGAALTAFSFDLLQPGLGRWLVTLATWLFALSTMIAWSYYGEQGVVFLFGERLVPVYKLIFCIAIVLSCAGLVRGTTQLNNLTMIGTGAMLFVNVPITLLFARRVMTAIPEYFARQRTRGN